MYPMLIIYVYRHIYVCIETHIDTLKCMYAYIHINAYNLVKNVHSQVKRFWHFYPFVLIFL